MEHDNPHRNNHYRAIDLEYFKRLQTESAKIGGTLSTYPYFIECNDNEGNYIFDILSATLYERNSQTGEILNIKFSNDETKAFLMKLRPLFTEAIGEFLKRYRMSNLFHSCDPVSICCGPYKIGKYRSSGLILIDIVRNGESIIRINSKKSYSFFQDCCDVAKD